ncbi:MAG: Ribonuclease HII [Methanomassiliicoccales archaeon PtaB.Bin134]|nr:MAG: Ribonuclease HII [Methanomassiliicoccales archaeon PtaB.Bin134]
MICGVDEAGRGPVMGPLVVAAVMVRDEQPLRELGVADSKLLTRRRREELDLQIRDLAEVELAVVHAAEIDEFMGSSSLNLLEVKHFAVLIERLRPDKVFIDAADVVEERFGRRVQDLLTCRPDMVCEHKADLTYPVVSAASIIAKVARDNIMDQIQESFGRPIGSGYAHDEVTIDFIRMWLKETGSLPPHVRASWKTAKDLISISKVSKLTDWMDTDDGRATAAGPHKQVQR